MITHIIPRGIVALGLLGPSACGLGDALRPNLPENCTSSSDCPNGFVCSAEKCVRAVQIAGPKALSLEAVPPTGSPFVRTQNVDIPVARLVANGFDIVFPAPTTYETTVLDARDNPISARVSIFGEERIPGREVDLSTQVSAHASPKTRLALNPDTYAVRITPLILSVPTVQVRGFTVREQTSLATKEFRLPAVYRILRGEVTSSIRAETKLANFVVYATGDVTGLVSTTAISDEAGRYAIMLPESEDTQFWVQAVPPDRIQPAFGYRQLINVPLDSGRELRIPVEPVNPNRHGDVRLTVLGLSRSEMTIPISDALVTITATVSRVREAPVHELTGSTDANGVVHIDRDTGPSDVLPVLQERYLVRVQPDEGAGFAPAQRVLDFTRAGQTFVLDEQVVLQPRALVSGRLVLASGHPAAGARINMEPLAEDARASSTLADAEGFFSLTLDPGRHLFVAAPVASTDEPQPVTVRIVEVPAEPERQLGQIQLPAGVWVGGRVLGRPEALPVVGAEIFGFVQVRDRTIRVARSQTGPDGHYRIALPVP